MHGHASELPLDISLKLEMEMNCKIPIRLQPSAEGPQSSRLFVPHVASHIEFSMDCTHILMDVISLTAC